MPIFTYIGLTILSKAVNNLGVQLDDDRYLCCNAKKSKTAINERADEKFSGSPCMFTCIKNKRVQQIFDSSK